MERATTLVHKGAMEIAVYTIRSFARHFRNSHSLEIHTDGSPGAADCAELLEAAEGMQARVVTPDDRREALAAALSGFPKSAELISRGGYFVKFELPICVPKPFFYFDSDIVWLAPVESFAPPNQANAFSTESWSWYHGVANGRQWIREKIPRRVNSGFYYLRQEFPHERLERLINDRLYDSERPYSTDQEIMAFLYPDMEYYHPEDLKRSRRGVIYELVTDPAAALHFPGNMWKPHLDQIEKLDSSPGRETAALRFRPAVPLSALELARMRMTLAATDSTILRGPVNLLRTLRRRMRWA